MTHIVDPAILAAYDFSSCRRIVDVGGGHGSFITSILKANPGMEGILVDLSEVAEGARKRLAAEGIEQRCEVVFETSFNPCLRGAMPTL